MHAFYAFARTGDDIADDPCRTPEDKLRALDALAEGLRNGASEAPPVARRMAESIGATGHGMAECMTLLSAFRQDAVVSRYASLDALLAYCALSAVPVGRYLLALHGETASAWRSADALAVALQLLNHLQDCREDLLRLDRIYLPLEVLDACGASERDLRAGSASMALRAAVDRILDMADELLTVAAALPRHLTSRRLALESRIVLGLAGRLARRLRRQDPLRQRVSLAPADVLVAIAGAFVRRGG